MMSFDESLKLVESILNRKLQPEEILIYGLAYNYGYGKAYNDYKNKK